MSSLEILDLLPPPDLRGEDEHRYLTAALHRFTETTVRIVQTGERTPMERPLYRLELVAGEPAFLAYYASTNPQPHAYATRLALDLLLAWRFYRAGESSAASLAILTPILAGKTMKPPEADALLVVTMLSLFGTTIYLIWRNSYERARINPNPAPPAEPPKCPPHPPE
jgi:hypothetical protein